MQRITVIFNPNSRKNRKRPAAFTDQLRDIVGDFGEVHVTRDLSELRPVLESALERGTDYLVSDGGDGSIHWAANEAWSILQKGHGLPELPKLVPTNGGTIDFLARKAGITGDARKILLRLTER